MRALAAHTNESTGTFIGNENEMKYLAPLNDILGKSRFSLIYIR